MSVTEQSAADERELREGVRNVCAAYPDAYWRELDAKRAYPDAFVAALNARQKPR